MNFNKGQIVFVVDKADGKPYQCKILIVREDLIKIHYHGWNSKYDEWLQQDSPRLVQQDDLVPSLSQSQNVLDDSVVSAETLIDSMAESLLAAEGAGETSGLPADSVSQSIRLDVGDAAAPFTPSGATTERASSGDDIVVGKRKRGDDSPGDTEDVSVRKRPSVQLGSGPLFAVDDGFPRVQEDDSSSLRSVDAEHGAPGAVARGFTRPAVPLINPDASGTPVSGTTVAGGETGDVAPGNGLVKCGLCQLPTGGSVIRCSSCNSCFHPDTLCLGVNREVLSVLLGNQDGAIVYRCCSCRSQNLSGQPISGDCSGVAQLLKIVGELVKEVSRQSFEDRFST